MEAASEGIRDKKAATTTATGGTGILDDQARPASEREREGRAVSARDRKFVPGKKVSPPPDVVEISPEGDTGWTRHSRRVSRTNKRSSGRPLAGLGSTHTRVGEEVG